MKRTYLAIAALMMCASMTMAQSPANRTSKTIVADVLAQMPAQKNGDYNKLMSDLSSTGEQGVMALVAMMNPPGKQSNANVEYALSGLTHFVAKQKNANARLTVANAYVKALGTATDNETKAFIIRQLQVIGNDECTDALGRCLDDTQLSGPAARALAAIGTEKAGTVLVKALDSHKDATATTKSIVTAIAEMEAQGAEQKLLALATNNDTDLKKCVLYALSRVGGPASASLLAQEAAKADYTMDKTGANEAYLALIEKMATGGHAAEADKAAAKLAAAANKAGMKATAEAALQKQIMAKIEMGKESGDMSNVSKLVVAAMKNKSKDYRNAVLNYASTVADKDLYLTLLKTAIKAKPETKADILNWIGREAKMPEKHDVIKNLTTGKFLTIDKALAKQLESDNIDVKTAAAWAMVKIGDHNFAKPLAQLLKSNDKKTVELGKNALASLPANINNVVTEAIPLSTDAGKIAGLQLLAKRKAASRINTVLEMTRSDNAEVKAEALTALKDVVGENDINKLCDMLQAADDASVRPLQQALVAAIQELPADKRATIVTQRMKKAADKDYLYFPVLAATNDPQALETISNGFRNGNGKKRDAAFDALLEWKGIEAADVLYGICKENASSKYFEPAMKAYVKLASNEGMTGENRLLRLRKAMEIAKTDGQKNDILKKIEKTGTFLGMMYAGEYLDAKPVQQAAANAVMNIALANKNYTGKNVRDLLDKVMKVLDNPDADYQREAIRKHLAEMPEEEGFVSLFNGKDLTGWKGLVENPIARAKMKPAQLAKAQEKADENMRRDWKVENGLLLFDGSGFDNLCTVKQYGDFEMYVDWMLDPSGKEADAGIYLRGTPQVQIWDTARVNVGAQVGSGGLYNNQTNESKPKKVADNKLGEWNSFYIKMVGDRVTVVLNGEKVVDDVILENYWDRSLPIFPTEQIELQAHGSKVYYRNIYIKELARKEPFKLSAEEKKQGFEMLFDGTNMHEWTGNTVDYTLEDGCISMNPSKSFGGNLYTKKEYADFIYRFDFQLTPGANNGVGIRTPMEGDAAYVGMEIQILDCEHQIYKDITPLQHHGSVYGIIPAKADHHKAFKPAGEWNSEEIYAKGDYIRVTVNGTVITEGNIREATKNGTADKQDHPGLFNKKGHIGFLGHGSPVKFRNIRIKELK